MMFSTFPTVVRAQLWPRIGTASLLGNGPVLESVVCMALGPGSIRARMRRIVVIVTVIVVIVVVVVDWWSARNTRRRTCCQWLIRLNPIHAEICLPASRTANVGLDDSGPGILNLASPHRHEANITSTAVILNQFETIRLPC